MTNVGSATGWRAILEVLHYGFEAFAAVGASPQAAELLDVIETIDDGALVRGDNAHPILQSVQKREARLGHRSLMEALRQPPLDGTSFDAGDVGHLLLLWSSLSRNS